MAELTPRMKELVQPYLAGIEPYDPNFTPTRINLSANENTYPVPAGVREAVDAVLAATGDTTAMTVTALGIAGATVAAAGIAATKRRKR